MRENWMTPEKWAYIEENQPLMIWLAEKMSKRYFHVSMEELISAVNMVAVQCMRSWDESKGRFSTYLYRACCNNVSRLVHQYEYNEDGQLISLDRSMYFGDDTGTIADSIPSDESVEDDVVSMIDSERLYEAIDNLPPDLAKHAYDTLSGNVSWKHVDHTMSIRRDMLKHLREEMQ